MSTPLLWITELITYSNSFLLGGDHKHPFIEMLSVTFNGLSYAAITNNPKSKWLKTTKIIFCSCYMSTKGQPGYFVYCGLSPAQAHASHRPGGENWGSCALAHGLLRSRKWHRPVPLTFQWPVQVTWPNPTLEHVGREVLASTYSTREFHE